MPKWLQRAFWVLVCLTLVVVAVFQTQPKLITMIYLDALIFMADDTIQDGYELYGDVVTSVNVRSKESLQALKECVANTELIRDCQRDEDKPVGTPKLMLNGKVVGSYWQFQMDYLTKKVLFSFSKDDLSMLYDHIDDNVRQENLRMP